MAAGKYYLLMLPVFMLGYWLGHISFSQGKSAVREATSGIDLSQPIRVYSSDNSFKMSLTPTAYQANGKSVCLIPGQRDELVYIDFGNGFMLSCEKTKE